MMPPFELLLFATDDKRVRSAAEDGIDRLVVDLESRGKSARQMGRDTQISAHDLSDLEHFRGLTALPIVCRINAPSPGTDDEIRSVVAAGADEVLVPMVRSPNDLDQALEAVAGSVQVSCMLETREAIARASELAARPIARAYIGLNDLAIDRGLPSIFSAFVDGTVERTITACGALPVGVGGLTHPNAGSPLPCRLLIAELARVGATFTFLRRSFLRDVAVEDTAEVVALIRAALAAARRRTPGEVARDRVDAHRAMNDLVPA